MKSPLYALLVAPDSQMRADILTGRKAISIREGHRDYQPGTSVMLCCHIEPWAVMADITSVRHCSAKDVTSEEIADDGFSGFQDFLTQMRRFYPIFNESTLVTIIRWNNLRGKLAE